VWLSTSRALAWGCLLMDLPTRGSMVPVGHTPLA
jgi:hypothetical protein